MVGKISIVTLLFACIPALGAASELRVGAAAEVITPAAGTPMSGYNSTRVVESVDDDLYAKAIVIERDGVKVALVACDLITMPRPVAEEARRLIAEKPGIPADHVMISATHTHTGPLLAPKSSPNPSDGDAERVRAYVKSLPERIAAAVRKADANRVPARALAGRGNEPRLSFNRRYFMKDGPVGWNPGKLNPNIDRPAGPVDPDVPVVYFESHDKTAVPIATHVSFAMHPDTRHGDRISADYPGRLADILSKVKGPEMITLFATGACGDINHVNVNFHGGQISPKESSRIGTILAGEVLKVYGRLQPLAPGAIRVRSEVLSLPLPPVTPEEVDQARATLLKPPPPRVSLDHVHALKVLDVASRQGKPLDAEVQVIAFGNDVAWVALPGEIFVELGLEVKRRSPFKHTSLVELANGSVGYVPTKRAFAEGNYEPLTARCASGSGELIVESAVRLLTQLAADAPGAAVAAAPDDNQPPEGFVALFNGKDLSGWKGLMKTPLDSPAKRVAATPEELAQAQEEADKDMRQHWSVQDGVLRFDGKGRSLATVKDYGDFEMLVDWKINEAGDSGIYLRGTPQVQIWDPASKVAGGVGSGGLYNNEKGPSKPSKVADKPIGEWNTFWIKMLGEKVWVKLNGEMVVDGVVMENYWERDKAIYPTGQIELQNHRNPLFFKNIYIKELAAQK